MLSSMNDPGDATEALYASGSFWQILAAGRRGRRMCGPGRRRSRHLRICLPGQARTCRHRSRHGCRVHSKLWRRLCKDSDPKLRQLLQEAAEEEMQKLGKEISVDYKAAASTSMLAIVTLNRPFRFHDHSNSLTRCSQLHGSGVEPERHTQGEIATEIVAEIVF